MGIDLGGGDIRVPEQLLHDAEVRTAREQVGGEAVSERMR